MAANDDLARLHGVEHVVVLMMENRSFDHMLGYLQKAGMKVNGLTGNETNPDDAGQPVQVFEYPPDFTAFHKPGEPLDESLDPQHDPEDVAEQLDGGNQGFVTNFIAKKNPPPQHRNLPMGHFTATHLPVYLAHTFCVCDSWHSSIPGDTMPNRCYSIAGEEGPSVVDKLDIFSHLVGLTIWSKLENIPIYDLKAFHALSRPHPVAVVLTRSGLSALGRRAVPAALPSEQGQLRLLQQEDGRPRAARRRGAVRRRELPRRRRERKAAGRVVDRSELHRPSDLRPHRRRRPSAVGHPRRTGVGARPVRSAGEQPPVERHGARDHLR